MKLTSKSPLKPKQSRSIRRLEEALLAAENILIHKGIHAITIKEVSITSGIKRPSLYKFFLNNESIIIALREKHLKKLLAMFKANTSAVKFSESHAYINRSSILLSNNTYTSSASASNQITASLSEEFIATLEIKSLIVNKTKILNIFCIINAMFLQGFYNEMLISPRTVNETKRACLSYLSA
jgi:AcrR family transcriptional regulator